MDFTTQQDSQSVSKRSVVPPMHAYHLVSTCLPLSCSPAPLPTHSVLFSFHAPQHQEQFLTIATSASWQVQLYELDLYKGKGQRKAVTSTSFSGWSFFSGLANGFPKG